MRTIRPTRRTRNVITITDVAHHAGVSPMTVSRVVNNEKNVRATTRDTVLKAVRELNYMPNLAARSLAAASHTRIGVIYSNPSAAYLSEFLVGVLDESAGKGAELLLVKCEPGEAAERQAVERLIGSAVTGVVLPAPLSESRIVCETLKAAGIPMVGVATGRFRGEMSCVRIDNHTASMDMTRHLLALGHRRIGYIQGHPGHAASAERLAGFHAALAEAPGAEAEVVQGYFTFPSGLEAAEALLDLPRRPTAIFAANDDMAAAVVSVAHRRGLDVPRDLTVVGFDDTAISTTLWPELTTVRQPVSAMAAAAIDLLLRETRTAKDGDPAEPRDLVVEHTLVERQSSGPPPAEATDKPKGTP